MLCERRLDGVRMTNSQRPPGGRWLGGHSKVSRVIFLAAVLSIFTPPEILAAQSCDRVLCYFIGREPAVQWRIYDPVRRTDRLFLKLSEEASVRWDSSGSRVEYRVGRELFHADWNLGVKPRRVAVFPELPTIEDWWFNPDSSRWQLWTMASLPEAPGRPPYEECRAQLWQSSRNGMEWEVVRADTQDCQDWYYPIVGPAERWSPDLASNMRRVPTVISEDLAPALSEASQGSELLEHSSACPFPLYYVPSRGSALRGVRFRYLAAAAPESPRPLPPVHWVDRKHGRRVLLCGPDRPCPEEITGVELTEQCGLLLVRCDGNSQVRLVDIATGADVSRSNGRPVLPRAGAVPFWGPPLKN